MAAIESLELFKQYNRAQYEAEFGAQPPPFDITRPDKLWFDQSETAGNYMRISRDESGKPSIVPMTMSRELAAGVNIPGAYRWPKWTPPATAAVQEILVGGSTYMNPVPARRLSTEEQARALAIELGGTFELDPSADAPGFFRTDYRGDFRRLYLVRIGDNPWNVGEMLAQKYVNGIGAPGQWRRDQSGGIYWEPAAQPTAQLDPKVKPVPVPCRQLAPDEEFQPKFAGIWTVEKKAPPSEQSESLRLLKLICQTFRIAF